MELDQEEIREEVRSDRKKERKSGVGQAKTLDQTGKEKVERKKPVNNDDNVTVHNNVHSYTKVEGIKCLYTNADSLRNKMSELRTIALNSKPEIIAVTEVIPKNYRFNIQDVEIAIPQYEMFRSVDGTNSERGCVIYVHKSLNPSYVQHRGI